MKNICIKSVTILTLILLCSDSFHVVAQNKGLSAPKFVYCQRDEFCQVFGDCCQQTPIQPKDEEILGACSERYYSEIVKCPTQFKDYQIQSYCENEPTEDSHLTLFLKVYHPQTGLLYKNKFCAVCNDVTDFQRVKFALWCKKGAHTKNVLEMKRLLINKTCVIAIFRDNPLVADNSGLNNRLCYTNTTSHCPKNTANDLSEKCKMEATYYVKDLYSGRYFKNKYCCKCTPPAKSKKTCSDLKNAYTHLVKQFGSDNTYTMLLDFNQWCGQECESTCLDCQGNITSTGISTYSKSIFSNLTILFCLLSIIGLLILITTYALIKDLRNFGGLITIALSATILFSQIVFLIAADSEDRSFRCKLFAALLHFSYLASFMWMMVFAADLIRTFYTTSHRSPSHPTRRLMKCCLVAFGLPFVVVILGFILDAASPDAALSPNYGTKICFFNSLWGGIVWFYIPVSLIILFNIGACIAAFLYLYKASKDGKRARAESSNERTSTFFLCLKLSALFGVFWMLLIIAVLVNNALTKEICALINCLQGFLISICFMATKRVKKAAKESLSKFSSTTLRSDHGGNSRSAVKYNTADSQSKLESK